MFAVKLPCSVIRVFPRKSDAVFRVRDSRFVTLFRVQINVCVMRVLSKQLLAF